MKLVLVTFIVAILLMSMTSFAVSSFSTPSQGHASFSAPLAFNPLTIKNRTLSSPNAQYYGFFGHSIAVSGKLVVVGAPFETADGYSRAGHAYVFNATSGALVTNLTSPNAQSYGYFGFSVAMSGKLVTVGAPYETADGYSAAGHAYVFNAMTGALITNLTSPAAQSSGYFGYSVAMSGKLVAVGAPYETTVGAGHAYVFNAISGALIASLFSPNAQADGFFGWSVAMSGKLVTVGAPFETADGYTQAGHTYIFKAMTGKLVTNLTSPNAQEYGYFGYSVGMSGKLVSVGALFENASGYSEAGHAYVFNAMTGKLIATLTSPNAQSGGAFGVSVAMSGKLVSVGAEGETADGYSAAGHAYVFKAGALIANLTSTNAEEGGYFGFSAAMSGKFVTVGAIGEYADGYQAAGNAYIFYNIK